MRITLTALDGRVHTCSIPYQGAPHVVVKGWCCPAAHEPIVKGGHACSRVRSNERRLESHDTYVGQAHCIVCEKPAGTLRVKMDTVFGIEEDERVLMANAHFTEADCMRCRKESVLCLDNGQTAELLCHPCITELHEEKLAQEPNAEAYRTAAQQQHSGNPDVDVDDKAPVSVTDDGAWVTAWLWVTNEQAGIEEEN